ncbi:MAG: PQQ-dependent sugar dehydrogenase [Acidimicrobiales bacterium]|nr:PQQ-dependent sugar dehydrogenase [Acidimicrobiales bacterium]
MSAPEAVDRVRWPLVVKLGIGLVTLAVVGGAAVLVFGVFLADRSDEPSRIITQLDDPVAPVALADGGFLVAERQSGRILRSTPAGELTETVRVTDELRTDGQRGLLGLALRRVGEVTEVFASWTRASDDRLVVGRLVEGGQMLVWEGPPSADIANGGTLVFRGEHLLIGVGELDDPSAVDDPSVPNGKVLALDPDGGPGQDPSVVASGWHNPFAITVVGDEIWLADNAPGDEPERLVRIPFEGEPSMLELEEKRAPSSLDVLPDGDLVLCGFVSEVVERVPTPVEGVVAPTEELGPPCATGVTVLADGSVVTTTADAVWRDPSPPEPSP